MDSAFLAMLVLHTGVAVLAILAALTAPGAPEPAASLPHAPPEAEAHVLGEIVPWPEARRLAPLIETSSAVAADLAANDDGQADQAWAMFLGDDPAASASLRGRVLADRWRQWPEARGLLI